jgi:hypothetical protein
VAEKEGDGLIREEVEIINWWLLLSEDMKGGTCLASYM